MRMLETLSQFIVPLIFLAIWALTSILNRDGQPLPRRPAAGPGRGPGPGTEPRPEDGFAPGRAEAPPPRRDPLAAARAEEAASSRAASGGSVAPRSFEPPPGSASARIGTARPPGRTTDADVYVIDDEMIFIDPVTRRRIGAATVPPHPQPTNRPPRRRSKERRPSQAPARSSDADAETRRALSEQIGKAMGQNQSQALTNLAPLSTALAGLSAASLHTTTAAATVTRTEALPTLSAPQVQRMLADPPHVREAALLAEILKPPVSRRPRRKI